MIVDNGDMYIPVREMTDEEKAEELTTKQFDLDTDKVRYFCNLYKNDYHEVHTFYNGVLKGIAEGKSKWHDLRKNPNDLPKLADSRFRWSITVANQDSEACIYNYRRSRWQTCIFTEINEPIMWCELPKFERQ